MDSEGRTGWFEYQETVFFRGLDMRTAYLAAKSGHADAGFTIKHTSKAEAVAIGEHGMTKYDWNVVAAVYLKEEGDGVFAKILVEGSKDVGFW